MRKGRLKTRLKEKRGEVFPNLQWHFVPNKLVHQPWRELTKIFENYGEIFRFVWRLNF